MKKIATITFHSSHNHGSNLQAYALQEYIKKISKERNVEIDYKIINLRNEKLKEINSIFNFKNMSIKKMIKNIFNLIYYRKIKTRYDNYEKFINNKLSLTKEYKTMDEIIKDNLDYDYYISGSDQLWNLLAYDFDWANYLEFSNKGKKISYSASFGPKAQTWNEEEKNRVRENLLKYDAISVREKGSFDNVYSLTGMEPLIHVDPTMLLDKEMWERCEFNNERIIKEKYILLYTLSPSKELLHIVNSISKKMKLPVVVVKFNNKFDVINSFIKKYDAGPIEFLNLLKNAELVLSSSFHGTVFSILFEKPFFAINGLKDFRISNLLKRMNLEYRSIDINNLNTKCKELYDISFEDARKMLEQERNNAKNYLIKELEL